MLKTKGDKEFDIVVNNCERAVREIFETGKDKLHLNDYLPWLQKHKNLYKKVCTNKYNPFTHPENYKFFSIYERLSDLVDYIPFIKSAQSACESYEYAPTQDHKLCWSIKFDSLGRTLYLFKHKPINFNSVVVFEVDELKIHAGQYLSLLHFKTLQDGFIIEKYVRCKDSTPEN